MTKLFDTFGLILPRGSESRSISAENPDGSRYGGDRTIGDGTGIVEGFPDGGTGWKLRPCVRIGAGETFTAAEIDGPGIIRTMWFTGEFSRDYILRIYWDAQTEPSVECPMTDFFGQGFYDCETDYEAGYAPIDSTLLAVCPHNGFNSYFPMPFRRHARITIENRRQRSVTLYYQINYELGGAGADALYFHAQFRQAHGFRGGYYTLLDEAEGQGRYIGTMLHRSGSAESSGTHEFSHICFYADGDESAAVKCCDDYFGGVGERPDIHGGVHLAETVGGEEGVTRCAMYRWQDCDSVWFNRRLRVVLSSGTEEMSAPSYVSSVAYWYQTLPARRFPAF